MKKTLLSLAIAMIASQANAGTVTSDGADLIIKSKGGLQIKTADGKHSVKFGGRIMLDYNNYDGVFNADQNGASGSEIFFRRARLFMSGQVNKVWKYKTQFNVGETSGGTVEDLYIKYTGFGKKAQLTFGNQQEPFGLEEQTSSKYITAIERTAATNAYAPGRNVGIKLSGYDSNWTYGIGIFDNGQDANESIETALTGRVTFAPVKSKTNVVHIGAGFTNRSGSATRIRTRPELRQVDSSDRISSGNIAGGQDFEAFNLEGAFISGPFHVSAEYFDSSVSATGGDFDTDGSYIQAGFFLTGESRPYSSKKGSFGKVKPKSSNGAWELFLRTSTIDLQSNGQGNGADILTLGVNWYANSNIRVGFNLIDAEYDQAIGTQQDGTGFASRLQYIF